MQKNVLYSTKAIQFETNEEEGVGIGLDEVFEFSDHKNLSTLMIYRDRERNVQGQLSQLISCE